MKPEEYVKLPYHIVIVPSEDDDGRAGWVASVEEFPGCWSQGECPNEAIAGVRDAMMGWISVMQEDGREIPLPHDEPSYSGKFVVRVPHSLHAELARRAQQEGVSLNQFISSALAGAVGWRAASASAGREPTHA
jgi:antitoxin HicB